MGEGLAQYLESIRPGSLNTFLYPFEENIKMRASDVTPKRISAGCQRTPASLRRAGVLVLIIKVARRNLYLSIQSARTLLISYSKKINTQK